MNLHFGKSNSIDQPSTSTTKRLSHPRPNDRPQTLGMPTFVAPPNELVNAPINTSKQQVVMITSFSKQHIDMGLHDIHSFSTIS